MDIPATRRHIESRADNGSELVGKWQGKLVTYDWSGEEIEKESNLNVVFKVEDNSLIGFWIENETNPVRISATQEGMEWVFDNTLLYEDKRPLQMQKGNFKIETNNNTDYLVGNVSFYSEATREFTQPNYIILKRNNTPTSITHNTVNGINISPNPFKDILNVRFTLEIEDNININIYDMSGQSVYVSKRQAYLQGENNLTINTSSFSNGSYILQIVGETIELSTVIIK